MNTRRGFFKSLFKAAAIVALAPQIAFRIPQQIATVEIKDAITPFWYQTTRYSACVDEEYRKVFSKLFSRNPENFVPMI